MSGINLGNFGSAFNNLKTILGNSGVSASAMPPYI